MSEERKDQATGVTEPETAQAEETKAEAGAEVKAEMKPEATPEDAQAEANVQAAGEAIGEGEAKAAEQADASVEATAQKSAEAADRGARPDVAVSAAQAAEPAAAPAPGDAADAAVREAAAPAPARAERPAGERPRPAARAGAAAEGAAPEAAAPKQPSPNQPLLDRVVAILRAEVAEDAVTDASINEIDAHIPTVVVASDHWLRAAETLRNHPELRLNYLRNLSGVDQETHLEVVYHLISLETKTNYCFRVTTSREAASIPSVTSVWETANWNEREVYDLLGIEFTGHPNLTRIMLSDDWVGHPLRKDYEQLDPEV